MKYANLDKTDLDILTKLQEDGRLSNVALADDIHLSPSPCLRRVKQLEAQGVIQGYHARIDRLKAGFSMTVFVEVRLNKHADDHHIAFENAIIEMEDIISAHLVSGLADYKLEVVARDLPDYESILKQIQSLPHVKDIQSYFAIRSVKTSAPLPLAKTML
ncbi:Lrp/AsnC family transcriptional regulator [Marinomonas posidonica]|uniref:Transcriptional regulator, AsnC family n=1 Tax=Marinomonas posidonica (strain CECT 7376 / NCIMB 14433 / IVIA-Po-181) TaxID=491952 RepID=F6CXL5_MARPP|nr:Lrp/AsnC family transcriptional regulator [Marinomonas posidonica]AEF53328.1 transcriptional regulator, AsnC family [Marinomonas posidonica IVIA-Po-181]